MLRTLATGLAVNRILFGVNFLRSPTRAGRLWIGGRAARRPENRVFGRALGARDLALGLGALRALREGDDAAAERGVRYATPARSIRPAIVSPHGAPSATSRTRAALAAWS
jgi:hypothetical protein